jgi:hypothetical protein
MKDEVLFSSAYSLRSSSRPAGVDGSSRTKSPSTLRNVWPFLWTASALEQRTTYPRRVGSNPASSAEGRISWV